MLFDGPAIHKRLDEIAAQITEYYSDRELVVIAILTGTLMFMSDLLRRIPLPLKLNCLSVASYHGQIQTSGEVLFKELSIPDVSGQDVLILDDIWTPATRLRPSAKRWKRPNHAAFVYVCC